MTLDLENLRIGYFDVMEFEDKSIRGGLLILDKQTYPLQFFATDAVKISRLQSILYGNFLTQYIYNELLAGNLVQHSENANLILTKYADLIKIRPKVSVPICYISQPPNEKISMKLHPEFKTERDFVQEVLLQIKESTDVFEPFERLQAGLSEIHKLRNN